MTGPGKSRYQPLTGIYVAIVVGVLSTIAFSWLGTRMDQFSVAGEVRALHEARVSRLRIVVDNEIGLLHSLRALYLTGNPVDGEQFNRFVDLSRRDAAAMVRVYWAPAAGGPGASPSYSLRFAAPAEPEALLIGTDLTADPVLARLAARAQASSQLQISRRLSLSGAGGTIAANVALLAVQAPGVDGLLVGLLRSEQLLRQAVLPGAERLGLLTTLVEWQPGEAHRIVASAGARALEGYDAELAVSSVIDVGGRSWRIESAPSPAFVALHGSYWRWWGLIYGLFGTLFTVAYLMRNYGEFQRIERMVARRTAELRFEEERVHQIIDLSHSGVLLVDSAGRIGLFNPGAEKISGFRCSEVTGHLLTDVFPDTVFPDPGQGAELALPKIDGSVVWVEVSVDRMQVHSRQYALIVFTDITERRAAAIEQERARKAAEAAAEIKEEFLANMSHEMRTPLNAIIGMTSFLLEGELEVEQKQYAETLRVSGQSLLAMVNSVLDYYQLQRGNLAPEQHDFALRECVEDTVAYFGRRANAKQLSLRLEYDDRLPASVIGDDTRIRQVLYNLISNAIKFTNHGEVCVEVGLQHQQGRMLRVLFKVRDTGIGIEEQDMPMLFQAFTQLDSSPARRYEGAGLGLVISRKLVELMSGTIGAESTPGKGSLFSVNLPLRVSEEAVEPERERDALAWLAGLRVMVVDDRPEDRATLENWLRRKNIVAMVYGNGRDALNDIESGVPPDIVFIDYMMPVMNGVELARAIRRGTQPGIYLVLTSSLRRSAFPADDAELFDAYLEKPIIGSGDIEVVLAPLRGRRRDTPLPAAAPVAAVAAQSGIGARVLVVDDNSVNQMLTRKLLEKLGCEADVAGNGLEAIEAVASKPYDLVFMDIQMPEMDGVEATRRILGRKDLEQPPAIVALTANTLPGDRERYLEVGMREVLGKPVNIANIKAVLERFTDRSGS